MNTEINAPTLSTDAPIKDTAPCAAASVNFLLARYAVPTDQQGIQPPLVLITPNRAGVTLLEDSPTGFDAMWVLEQPKEPKGSPRLEPVAHISSWGPIYDEGDRWIVITCRSGQAYLLENERFTQFGEISRDWSGQGPYTRMSIAIAAEQGSRANRIAAASP